MTLMANGHFTLNFHYYELPLRVNICLVICCRVCLHTHVTSGDVRKRTSGLNSIIFVICGKLGIFRRRYIVGILTNKANITY